MDKILVARQLVRLAKSIMAEDYDYIYDPDHKKKPGGGYVKTDKGWSKGKEDKGKSLPLPKSSRISSRSPIIRAPRIRP